MVLASDVRAFLDAPRFAVLATLDPDGTPNLTVIWYARRDDAVIVNTTTTRRKARNLERDPRVSLLVGEMGQYVRLQGTARRVATGAEALRDIHDLAVRYDGPAAAERQTAAVWSRQARVTYEISVTGVYRYGFD
jgi:PPOX class probable F420-dependent enzyme